MDLSAAKSSFIRHEVDVWGSLRSLRTSLAGATARLSQQGAEVADLRLLYTDLRAEAAAAREEVRRQQSEFDQVVNERDQSRGRAAEAESRAGAPAADLAVAQVAASEQRARAGGTPWPFSVFISACFLRLCLRSFVLTVRRARVRPR
jgi:chromosome segregation ATPase